MTHLRILLFTTAGLLFGAAARAEPPTAGVEFFEKRIRPVLAEHCYQCHGPQKQKAGLRLDSSAAILAGGERGPAIVAGKPEQSRLIEAVRYTGDDLRMPPRGKLADAQIADLVAWVRMGAPGPASGLGRVEPARDYDLAARRNHWAYRSVRPTPPPTVKDLAWCTSPIDTFILTRLETAGLTPAPPADRRTLIRRLYFDLLGLPPPPAEVEAFIADTAPAAYERLVERLLASPRYGERWTRHWLDLVRYAETMGYEFDFDLYHAWRYRDYVIRALNADLPYDQFVVEHLAGDLLPNPRRHPSEGTNESILATAFLLFGEGRQTPVDIRQDQADRIDNQIDVLAKALLGQTIACARCHDHKFDAISTRDYYALAGYLKSSRYQQAFLDPPERITLRAAELAALRTQIRAAVVAHVVPAWQAAAGRAARYLLAARDPDRRNATDLDPGRVACWARALQDKDLGQPQHPLCAWVQGDAPSATARTEGVLFEDFRRARYDGWYVTGDAFGPGPAPVGAIVVGDDRPVTRLATGGADSGLLSRRLQGELRSRTFTLEQGYLHFRLAGQHARVNLVVDGYTLIMKPMYDGLTIEADSERPAWRTMDVRRWRGHRAYIEISDSSILPLTNPPAPADGSVPSGLADAYIVVEEVRCSDDRSPPREKSNHLNIRALERAAGRGTEGLAAAYQDLLLEAIEHWCSGTVDTDEVALLNWALAHGLLDGSPVQQLAALLERYRQIEAALPEPQRAPALADGTGEDECVFIRGNHKAPGARVPRRPPEVLGDAAPAGAGGSGRLELARRLTDPTNPLLARVLVNRLWQHHFGKGLVRTPDDFGRMGQPPTHYELLDYLAAEFMRQDWSIKKMHRLMLLSSTYQMASRREEEAERRDPENRLLHRMPLRRLEGEALRDAILAVSGRLDGTMYGPGVLPYLTPHMEGRGRPKSGPLDGNGRRSIYLNVRRNFLTPLLLAFDYPVTFSTLGQRDVTTVPSQALALMNDPFVLQAASRWAERGAGRSTQERIVDLYQVAFARPPSAEELHTALQFVTGECTWGDLCHVLLNVKEFYVIP